MHDKRWPELPDECFRAAMGVAKKWAIICPTLADDIFQEARLAAWLAVECGPHGDVPLHTHVWRNVTWACKRVVGNYRFWRFDKKSRRTMRREQQYEMVYNLGAYHHPSTDTDISMVWRTLTDRQALALHLTVVCDMSLSQTAKQMGLTKNRVNNLVRSGRAAVKRFIEG